MELAIYRGTGAVAEIRFNRPGKKNAITEEMYAALAEALMTAEADGSVHAILIGGERGAFTAGNDLKDVTRRPFSSERTSPLRRFMTALSQAHKPVVAAVDGVAIGIGATLLLHCDLVVASTRARVQMPFVSLGLTPEFASTLLLPQQVGRHVAAELLLLGETLDAQTAFRLGLVNRVTTPEELDVAAMSLARRLAAKPPEALREAKRLMRADAAEIERRIDEELAVFGDRLCSPEARSLIMAMLEKRPPESAGEA